ncbi:MAG: ketoacyl-ACP synthase III [Nonlabens sp.]
MTATIRNISYHLPQDTYPEDRLYVDFKELKGQKALQRLGVKNRHVISNDETASGMAIKAAKNMFDGYGVNASTIDYVIFCSQEFDYYTPSTACVIQHKLGIPSTAGALDFNLGCTGFLYGLSMAKGLIETNQCSNVLLLTASCPTRRVHPEDGHFKILFGDAAAATLISSSESNHEYGKFIFGTDGSKYQALIVEKGAGQNLNHSPDAASKMVDRDYMLSMDGIGILNFTMEVVPELVNNVLNKNNLKLEDVDLCIFHQPNKFILEQLRKKIGIDENKFIIHIEDTGNTVSSTIPIALAESLNNGKAKRGMKIMLIAFGVGLSWAGTVIKL